MFMEIKHFWVILVLNYEHAARSHPLPSSLGKKNVAVKLL
jgi:hypothetical protein